MALYNERVFSYEKMQELDQVIDNNPDVCGQMVANDVSNHLAFCELQSYNDHCQFEYKHPLLLSYKTECELDALRRADPARFMNELVNADKNITRYESFIRNKKYKSPEELNKWQSYIDEYTVKLKIMRELIRK